MTRTTAVVLALIIIGISLVSGNSEMLLRAAERGLAYGISREIAHSLFHGEWR